MLRLGLTFALVAAIGTTGATTALAGGQADDPWVDEWHTWTISLVPGVTNPTNSSHVTWPQAHVGVGEVAPPCGVWYQHDRYKGKRSQIDEVIADNTLTRGEDDHLTNWGNYGSAWQFVYGGDCALLPTDSPTDPPVTDPPTDSLADPPVTDPPVTDPPVTDPPVTDPPVTDPPWEPEIEVSPVVVVPSQGAPAAVPVVAEPNFTG